MAAPRGPYTAPANSPIAGTVFTSLPGDAPTAPYNRYLQARAKALGFSNYSDQKKNYKKYRADNRYEWAIEKTLGRRFDVEVYGGGLKDLERAGRHELAQKVDGDILWAKAEGISGYTYKDAITYLYAKAEKDGWSRRANGPYARLLELMGIRQEYAIYDVGDTPK